MDDPENSIYLDTRGRSEIDEKTLRKLNLASSGKSTSCFIETFAEIGWKDPFPLQDEVLVDIIRPMESFALPSRRLMLNIMRACVSMSDPLKLWINHQPDS